MSQTYPLKIICPTHGRNEIPKECQKIRQWSHARCGGQSNINIGTGKLICTKCGLEKEIQNFSFFCSATNSYMPYTPFEGDIIRGLFNQVIGFIDDDDEQDQMRKIFKSLYKK